MLLTELLLGTCLIAAFWVSATYEVCCPELAVVAGTVGKAHVVLVAVRQMSKVSIATVDESLVDLASLDYVVM